MLTTPANLVKAIEAAQGDLALRQDRIEALDAELATLRSDHEEAEKKAAERSEVSRQVEGVLSRLLSGEALKGLAQPAEDPAERQAAQRRVRIETLAAELDLLEVEEELLVRALERPGRTLLPRRPKADVVLVIAPQSEIEAALTQSTAPRALKAR
jgi:chromosome segregation ATPase